MRQIKGMTESASKYRSTTYNPPIIRLGDDELHYIFNIIRHCSPDRTSFILVSKRFMKVACLNLIKLYSGYPDLLFDILPSSPNLRCFFCHKPLSNVHLKLLAHSCPKLEILCLDVIDQQGFDVDFDDEGLCALASSCSDHLSMVLLDGRLHVGDVGIVSLVTSFDNLIRLNLTGCIRVTDKSLITIGESRIGYLNLEGCCLVSDIGVEFLASGNLKNFLKELNLSGCDMISDKGVIHLKQMVDLTDLSLSKCGVHVTDTGIVALISQLPNIEYLDLSWLINVTDISLLAIGSKCLKLIEINLNGCEAITANGLRAFSGHQTLGRLSLFSCYNFTWEDVKSVALTCIALNYLGLMDRISSTMLDGYQYYFRPEFKNCWIDWSKDNDTLF